MVNAGFDKNYVCVKIYRYGKKPQLTSELKYTWTDGTDIVVPKGFETDFASIPRILWNIIAPLGKHTNASILHDYLYTEGYKLGIDRKKADKIFFDAMLHSSVAQITANVMWFCVRLFARKHYNKG